MNRICRVISLVAVGLLYGCVSTPTKPPSSTQTSFDSSRDSSYFLAIATSSMTKWSADHRKQDLLDAHAAFSAGLALQPDDLNLQRGLYLASYPLAAHGQLPILNVSTLYERLHPLVKPTVATPYRLHYLEAIQQQLHGSEMLALIARSLKQDTRDEFLWRGFADELPEKHNALLRAALYLQAADRTGDKHQYYLLAAESYDDAFWGQNCQLDSPLLGQRALKYYLAAAKAYPDSSYINNRIGGFYGVLGLPPLALKYAQKAFETDPDKWTALSYGYALFYSGRYSDAKRHAAEVLSRYDRRFSLDLLSLLAFTEGDTKQAAKYAQELLADFETDGAEQLVWQWLVASDAPSKSLTDAAIMAPGNGINQAVLTFIRDPVASELEVDANSNSCEQSAAEFAMAIKSLDQGDTVSAKRHFEAVVALKNYFYAEFDYSLGILQSGRLQ